VAVSGTYAEPGSQTYRVAARERRQLIAECRYCGNEVMFYAGSEKSEWRHVSTGDSRCSLSTATPTASVA
jgi:hypothetical protein